MSEERLNRKALLICQKYELEDVINRENNTLMDMMDNEGENRGRIADQLELIESLGRRMSRIEERIAQEEQREADRQARIERGEELSDDDGMRIIIPANRENEENDNSDEEEEDSSDEDEEDSEELNRDTSPQNIPFNADPAILERFSHVFANADAPVQQQNRNRPLIIQFESPIGINIPQQSQEDTNGAGSLFDILMDRNENGLGMFNLMNNLEQTIANLENIIGAQNYERYANLEDVPVPVKDSALKKIPIKLYSEVDKEHKMEKNIQCSICLCEYEKDDEISHLPCNHIYHPDCIEGWFKNSAKCPVCKYDVNTLSDDKPTSATRPQSRVRRFAVTQPTTR